MTLGKEKSQRDDDKRKDFPSTNRFSTCTAETHSRIVPCFFFSHVVERKRFSQPSHQPDTRSLNASTPTTAPSRRQWMTMKGVSPSARWLPGVEWLNLPVEARWLPVCNERSTGSEPTLANLIHQNLRLKWILKIYEIHFPFNAKESIPSESHTHTGGRRFMWQRLRADDDGWRYFTAFIAIVKRSAEPGYKGVGIVHSCWGTIGSHGADVQQIKVGDGCRRSLSGKRSLFDFDWDYCDITETEYFRQVSINQIFNKPVFIIKWWRFL